MAPARRGLARRVWDFKSLYSGLYLRLDDTHSYPCTRTTVVESPKRLCRCRSCPYLLEDETLSGQC